MNKPRRWSAALAYLPSDNQGYMATIVTYGTFAVATLFTILFGIYYSNTHDIQVTSMLLGFSIVAFIYSTVAALAAHWRHYKVTAWMMVILYGLIATIVLGIWQFRSPAGSLILGFTIFLSGVVLGARYIIPIALGAILVIVLIQIGTSSGILAVEPDKSIIPDSYIDKAVAYGLLLLVFGLLAWLAAHRAHHAAMRIQEAESKLKNEKLLLASRLEKRSQELRQSQLEEIRHMYKFATIGQSTTAILHDLSNHLSVLSFDINNIVAQHKHSNTIAKAQESIRQINQMINKGRQQLSARQNIIKFNALAIIRETIHQLSPMIQSKGVFLNKVPAVGRTFRVMGDPVSLAHVITILINNACEACQNVSAPRITLTITKEEELIVVTVSDNGPGIPKDIKSKLFQPIRSTKPSGLGIGLYIIKHTIETQFRGTVQLDTKSAETSFVIRLPEAQSRRAISSQP